MRQRSSSPKQTSAAEVLTYHLLDKLFRIRFEGIPKRIEFWNNLSGQKKYMM